MPSCNRSITCLMSLHLSRLWAPLSSQTWVPARCGSRVLLSTERCQGLGIRPVKNEQEVAPGRGAHRVILLFSVETDVLWVDNAGPAHHLPQHTRGHRLQSGAEHRVGALRQVLVLPCRQLAWLGLSPPQSRLPVSIHQRESPSSMRCCSRRDRSLYPQSRSSPPRRRRTSRDPSAYFRDRSPFHRARSPFPRDRSPSYRSGRSPRGHSLSSRPSRTSPYCPLHCSRARSPSPVGFHPVSCRDHPPWVRPVSWRDPRLHLDPTGHGGHLPVDPVPVRQVVDVADADSQLTSVYYSSVPNPPDILSRIETLIQICQIWILLQCPLQLNTPLPLRTFRRSSRTLISPLS